MVKIQLDKLALIKIQKGGKFRNLLGIIKHNKSVKIISEKELIIHSELTDKQFLQQIKINEFIFKCPKTGINGYIIDEGIAAEPVIKHNITEVIKEEQIEDINMVKVSYE